MNHHLTRLVGRGWRLMMSIWLRRQLARAEAELGRAGWQTCDFSGEIEMALSSLNTAERMQITLLNQRAQTTRDIAMLEEQLAECSSTIESTSASLAERDTSLETENRQLNLELSGLQQKITRFAAAAQALEDELAGRTRSKDINRPLWQVQLELTEIRSRLEDEERKALALEAARLSAQRQQEKDAAPLRERLASAQNLSRKLTSQLRALRKKHAEIQRQLDDAERGKVVSYQKIGAVMADAGLGPPNQPELLERVLLLRQKLGIVLSTD